MIGKEEKMTKTKNLSIILLLLIGAILLASCQKKDLETESTKSNNSSLVTDGEVIEDVGKIESESYKTDEIADFEMLEEHSIFETVENESLKIEIKDMELGKYTLNDDKDLSDDVKTVIEENPYLVHFNCKITNISGMDREDEVFNAKLVDSEGREHLGSFVNASGFIVQLNDEESVEGRLVFNISDIENTFSSIVFETDEEGLKVNLD